jgi:hypothetical protein
VTQPDPRPRVLPGHDPDSQVRGAVRGSLAITFGFAYADLPPQLKEALVDDVLARSGDWPAEGASGMSWYDAARELADQIGGSRAVPEYAAMIAGSDELTCGESDPTSPELRCSMIHRAGDDHHEALAPPDYRAAHTWPRRV